MALALISVLPMVVLFLAFQRYFVQGSPGAVSDDRAARGMTYLCTLDLPDAWFDELAGASPTCASIDATSPSQPPPTDVLAERPRCCTRASGSRTQRLRRRCGACSSTRPASTTCAARRCGRPTCRSPPSAASRRSRWPSTPCMSILELAHRMPRIDQLRRCADLADERRPARSPHAAPAGRRHARHRRLRPHRSRDLAARRRRSGCGCSGCAAPPTLGGSASSSTPADSTKATTRPSSSRWTGSTRCSRPADILVVVVPLTELTRGMIGAAELDRLPHGALVVNIARGGIVDEAALLERAPRRAHRRRRRSTCSTTSRCRPTPCGGRNRACS